MIDYMTVPVGRVPSTSVGYDGRVWLVTPTVESNTCRLVGYQMVGIRYVPPETPVVPLTDVPIDEAGPNDVCWVNWDGKTWLVDTDLVARIREEDREDGVTWTVYNPAEGAFAVVHDSNVTIDCDSAGVAEALAGHLNASGWTPPVPRCSVEQLVREWVSTTRGRSLRNFLAEHGYEIADAREAP